LSDTLCSGEPVYWGAEVVDWPLAVVSRTQGAARQAVVSRSLRFIVPHIFAYRVTGGPFEGHF